MYNMRRRVLDPLKYILRADGSDGRLSTVDFPSKLSMILPNFGFVLLVFFYVTKLDLHRLDTNHSCTQKLQAECT